MSSHARHPSSVLARTLAVAIAVLVTTGAVVGVVAVAAAPAAAAATPEFRVEPVADGFFLPVAATFLPDGRAIVLEKGGEAFLVDPATGGVAPYLTITDLNDNGERGLLNVVLDPDFASNGYLYVYYTTDSRDRNRIARFTHVENDGGLTSRVDPASEVLVWENPDRSEGCCHFGGGLDVGPDGHLYLTTGEEFDGAKSQNLSLADGKIIRVATDGSIPSDNPFAADGDPDTRADVWAYGLRNPYRAQWDLVGDRFYVGEVGGNELDSREDVHVGRAGANYGWPDCEGDCVDPDYDDPIYSYEHAFREGETFPEGAVTVGPVYRGAMFPAEYVGALFYADYVFGWVKYLTFDGDGDVVASNDFLEGAGAVVDIREGPDGALYLVDIAGGSLSRVVYDGDNNAPTIAAATADVTEGDAPLVVNFTVDASDANGDPLTYEWTFGDGTTATGKTATHTYDAAGAYVATVAVSDGNATATSAPIRIVVGGRGTATIAAPADGDTFRAGETIRVNGTASDPSGAPLTGDALSWDVTFLHNTHTHPGPTLELDPDANGTAGSFTVGSSGHDYSSTTAYRITLTATDANGVTATDSVEVLPEKVNFTLATAPAGLSIDLDDIPRTAPYVHDTLIGFTHRVEAPAEQCAIDGTRYVFDGWADGNGTFVNATGPDDRIRTVTVPDVDAGLTATYRADGVCTVLPTEGLALLFESGRGVDADGSQVTGWPDAVGANDLTARGDPQLASDAPELNGRDYVVLDGVDDALVREGNVTGLPSGSADRTVLAVVRYDDVGFGGVGYGRDRNNDAFLLGVNDRGDLMVQGWGSRNDFPSADPGTGEGWLVQSVRLADDSFTLYRDGRAIRSADHRFSTDPARIVVGANADGDPVAMGVAAVVVYDRALSVTEHDAAVAYLSETYLGESPATGPTVRITAPDDGTVAPNGTVTVSWDATGVAPGDHVHVAVDGEANHTTVPDLNGSYEVTGLAPGTRTITVTVAGSGHVEYTTPEASDSVSVVVPDPNATTPTVTITAPANGTVAENGTVTVSWTASDVGDGVVELTVDDRTEPASVLPLRTTYEFTGLSPGVRTITATATGSDGTPLADPEASDSVSVVVPDPTLVDPFAAGVPGVSKNRPTDLDGDGTYEDVDGDGEFTFLDVVALLFADFDAINAVPGMIPGLDFDGDGAVEFLDVVDLLFAL